MMKMVMITMKTGTIAPAMTAMLLLSIPSVAEDDGPDVVSSIVVVLEDVTDAISS